MKYCILLLTMVTIFSCGINDEEQLIIDVSNTLPGTWEIVRFNNISSDSLNFEDAYFAEGGFLENFGTLTIPDFSLEYDDDNFISIILISCEFKIEDFSYPLFLTNQIINSENGVSLFQCELVRDNSREISGNHQGVEEIINNFEIFHSYYEIDVKSPDSFDLRLRYTDNEIVMNLVKVK